MCCCLQPADQLQLWKEEVVLEDAKKLAELKVENDDVVALCYQTAGGREREAGRGEGGTGRQARREGGKGWQAPTHMCPAWVKQAVAAWETGAVSQQLRHAL